jgi:disulfide bond formation protein DsbB
VRKIFRAAVLLAAVAVALFGIEAISRHEIATNALAEGETRLAAPATGFPTQTFDDDEHHHGMWGDWDGWGWAFMLPAMVIFWGGLLFLIVWLVRQSSRGASSNSHDNEP